MTYGKTIRQSREQKGMTQEELAERLGVSRQAVNEWEGDISRPTAAKLTALAALLDLPPENGQRWMRRLWKREKQWNKIAVKRIWFTN